MRIREFYPVSDEPQAVLILPNHVGSSFESDFSQRAEQLAEKLAMLVLAYERPGTSKYQIGLGMRSDLKPDRYVQSAAQTGRDLDAHLDSHLGAIGLKRILTGNSAAATDAVMVARSQTLQIDYLIAADPAGIQKMTEPEFRKQWLQHQRKENQLKKSSDHKEGLSDDPDANSGIVGKALLGVRFLRDAGLYVDIWRSGIVYDALNDIAKSDDFSDLATNVAFVEHSFTGTPEYMLTIVNALNASQQRSAGTADFKASFMPATYHSYFNDEQNYADFINKALAETMPTPNSTA